MAGRLIMVVGPSGVGKDTLISAASKHFEKRTDIVFPKRLVTRAADKALEDHLSISREKFDQMRLSGDHTLAWEAHGLGYIIPAQVKTYLATGKSAVFNGSRNSIGEAVAHYPDTAIIVVSASHRVRAHRLASRGRESAEQIEARLNREVAEPPSGAPCIAVDNSGPLANSVDAFVDAITRFTKPTSSEILS